jgi:hypothetical protein
MLGCFNGRRIEFLDTMLGNGNVGTFEYLNVRNVRMVQWFNDDEAFECLNAMPTRFENLVSIVRL